MKVLYVTLCAFVLDQLTKLAVKGVALPSLGIVHDGMPLGHSAPLIGDWLKFTYVENPNMAFGLSILGPVPLSLFALLASLALVYYLHRHRRDALLPRLAIALIIAGALGNLVDRVLYGVLFDYAPLFYGRVVDFIDVDLFTVNLGSTPFKFWPIFNIADSAVSVGVVLMLFTGFRPHHDKASAAEESAAAPGSDAPQGSDTPAQGPGASGAA